MAMDIEIRHQLGELTLNVAIKTKASSLALFGASGAGKTSIAHIIAGLVKADFARIVIDGEVLVDTKQGIFMPPYKRRIGFAFQDTRLFPHLTVAQNLNYGAWFSSAPKANPELLELLGLQDLLKRRPSDLSGGEKQRVAIGRAVLSRPRLLIMDEPLAALDGPRKIEILHYVERLRESQRLPLIYISHSEVEVSRLADDVAIMEQGRVVAFGPPQMQLAAGQILP